MEVGNSLVGSLSKAIARGARENSGVPLEDVVRDVVSGFASQVDVQMNVSELLSQSRTALRSQKRKSEFDAKRDLLSSVATRQLNMLPGDVPDSDASLLARRRKVMGEKMKLFFDPRPQHFVRALGMEMFDASGRRFYDFYNNVVSIGHCHPFVVGVLAKQAKRLNTNTRYLGDTTVQYAEEIMKTLHPSLDSIVYCNSGSEANDIAYRLCKSVTGNSGGLTMRHAYHGITDAMTGFTPALAPNGGQVTKANKKKKIITHRVPHSPMFANLSLLMIMLALFVGVTLRLPKSILPRLIPTLTGCSKRDLELPPPLWTRCL